MDPAAPGTRISTGNRPCVLQVRDRWALASAGSAGRVASWHVAAWFWSPNSNWGHPTAIGVPPQQLGSHHSNRGPPRCPCAHPIPAPRAVTSVSILLTQRRFSPASTPSKRLVLSLNAQLARDQEPGGHPATGVGGCGAAQGRWLKVGGILPPDPVPHGRDASHPQPAGAPRQRLPSHVSLCRRDREAQEQKLMVNLGQSGGFYLARASAGPTAAFLLCRPAPVFPPPNRRLDLVPHLLLLTRTRTERPFGEKKKKI